MSEPHVDVPAEGEGDIEEIDVPDVPEPGEPEEGEVDPDDTYTEGRG
jgi:hypothetical protein